MVVHGFNPSTQKVEAEFGVTLSYRVNLRVGPVTGDLV